MQERGASQSGGAEPITSAALRKRRMALGLSQHAIARMIGVPRNTLARWERGELRIARPDWLQLALARLEAGRECATPKAQTADVNSIGLPFELSSFVGRHDEVATCRALLATTRLLTFTGAGGIGKSRLATQVAREVADSFPHGVHLVEIAALEQADLVLPAVAKVLGIAERAGNFLIDLVLEALRPRKLLLIMDDCDRQVAACGALAQQLLRAAPNLVILATCREPLDVRGEVAWRVPAMALAPARASVDDIRASEAVQLFVARARSVAPWFQLTESNASRVADLCRRVDGIPLAIELAAARMKALSLEQLTERLQHSLALLSGGSRTAPGRQQTLSATVDWSYRLLNEAERALFRRLAVFAGGWSLEAAERVTAGEPIAPAATLNLLERLIDKSLVVVEERGGIVRLAMLDTLHEYAAARLSEAGEGERVRRQHAEWMLDIVEGIDPDVVTRSRIAELELELHNLRAALGWAVAADAADIGLRLASAAGEIWMYRGEFAEGLYWLRKALDGRGVDEYPALRGRALKWRASLYYGLGDMRAARTTILEAAQLLDGHAYAQEPPLSSQILGNIARASGDLTGALRFYRRSLVRYRQLRFRFWEALTLFMIGSVLFEKHDYARSREACECCLAIGERYQFPLATSRARIILAYLAQHDGDSVGARRLAEEALEQQRMLNEPPGIGISLRALSQFALERGHLTEAWSYLPEALEIARKEGDRMALARTLETVACVLAKQAPGQAVRIAGASASLRVNTGTAPWPTEQARLSRWLGYARAKIGAQAFDAEWQLGEMLSDGEAIAAANDFIAAAQRSAPRALDTHQSGSPLTPRQREVAELVALGLTNEQIAKRLVISPATARAHVEHVLDRLNLHSRAQIAAWAATHTGNRTDTVVPTAVAV
jgi:predicted ATPase/DNA-binding CsgD family transcriptional regulator/DNA-binding XRE family transcriptional regulator